MVDSRKPGKRQFIQEFEFQSNNLLSIPLNKYKSYAPNKDYVVLGVDFCNTQVNQVYEEWYDAHGVDPIDKYPVFQYMKPHLDKIDKVYIYLGDNVNIDTGIVSLYGDDKPNKLLFETAMTSEQNNNGGNGELFYVNRDEVNGHYDYRVRFWNQLNHTMQSNLNQNLDGIGENDLDLKDNEVLLKVQQSERIDLKVEVDSEVKILGITYTEPSQVVEYYNVKTNADYMTNKISYGTPFAYADIYNRHNHDSNQLPRRWYFPMHRNANIGMYIRTPM